MRHLIAALLPFLAVAESPDPSRFATEYRNGPITAVTVRAHDALYVFVTTATCETEAFNLQVRYTNGDALNKSAFRVRCNPTPVTFRLDTRSEVLTMTISEAAVTHRMGVAKP